MASWLAARVAVLTALALTSYLALPGRRGLLGWDAGHYLFIAQNGYPAEAPESARFFPLVPLLARSVSLLPAVSTGAALLVVANTGALVYATLLHRLVRAEGADEATAARAVWLLALTPPAFVLVMGYAEAVYGALVVAFLGSLRQRAWGRAAVLGLLAGTCRPVAVTLVAVALVEVVRGLGTIGGGEALRRGAAVLAPAAGTSAYLAYIGVRSGAPLLPFRVQADPELRGSVLSNPVTVVGRLVDGALAGDTVGSGLHVAWLFLFLVLLVPVARTLPASYTVLAGLTLLLASTSTALESLERYAWSAFPYLIALAIMTRRRSVFLVTLTVSAVGLVGYAVLTFAGRYVP